jgi:hypothetical protein
MGIYPRPKLAVTWRATRSPKGRRVAEREGLSVNDFSGHLTIEKHIDFRGFLKGLYPLKLPTEKRFWVTRGQVPV